MRALPALACVNSMREHSPESAEDRALRVARAELQRGNAQNAYRLATGLLEQGSAAKTQRWARRVAGLAALKLDKGREAVFYLKRASTSSSRERKW